ncbi:MAG: hypothetical protein RL026_199 [Pseudomonadota bacterium]
MNEAPEDHVTPRGPWPAHWPGIRSLRARLLAGLALIALPLLIALVVAAVQLRDLADTSERLVLDGVRSTRLTQELATQSAALERSLRVYQILEQPGLRDTWRLQDERLQATIRSLADLMPDGPAQDSLQALEHLRSAAARQVLVAHGGQPDFAAALDSLGGLPAAAAEVSRHNNVQIDAAVGALQARTAGVQRFMFWGTTLLLPLTVVAIIGFSLSLGRPLRQIDRAIDELGRGALTRPIRVDGPVDLQRLGRQLEWLRQRLQELTQERNRFLRHMSHELKTPLANIREGTELMMDGALGVLDAGQREVIGILRDNGIRLQRLIENLLSYSAWQNSGVAIETSRFRLRPLIRQVIESQQLTLLAQRIRLDVQVEDLVVQADRGKLRLILDNLLSNAIKYSPRAGDILVRAHVDGSQLLLEVGDSGPGIPPAERAQVFEAFYTGKAAHGHVKGTGIGLSVVLEFVNLHGGRVEIVDGECAGAHFRIRLPMPDVSQAGIEEANRDAA